MNRDKYKAVNGLLIAGLMAVLLIIYTKNASAQEVITGNSGDCAGRSSACADQAVSFSGGNALGMGFGGSTVTPAIGDCIFTEFDSYFIFWDKQRGKENKHCLAMQEHLIGNHDTEARIKCRDTSIGGLYDDPKECIKAQQQHTAQPVPDVVEQVAGEIENHELVAQQQYAATQTQYMQLIDEIQQLKAAKAPQTVVQQVPYLGEKQRAELRELKE